MGGNDTTVQAAAESACPRRKDIDALRAFAANDIYRDDFKRKRGESAVTWLFDGHYTPEEVKELYKIVRDDPLSCFSEGIMRRSTELFDTLPNVFKDEIADVFQSIPTKSISRRVVGEVMAKRPDAASELGETVVVVAARYLKDAGGVLGPERRK
jgi:hypothetical protein